MQLSLFDDATNQIGQNVVATFTVPIAGTAGEAVLLIPTSAAWVVIHVPGRVALGIAVSAE
jgi:hypothetical protein